MKNYLFINSDQDFYFADMLCDKDRKLIDKNPQWLVKTKLNSIPQDQIQVENPSIFFIDVEVNEWDEKYPNSKIGLRLVDSIKRKPIVPDYNPQGEKSIDMHDNSICRIEYGDHLQAYYIESERKLRLPLSNEELKSFFKYLRYKVFRAIRFKDKGRAMPSFMRPRSRRFEFEYLLQLELPFQFRSGTNNLETLESILIGMANYNNIFHGIRCSESRDKCDTCSHRANRNTRASGCVGNEIHHEDRPAIITNIDPLSYYQHIDTI